MEKQKSILKIDFKDVLEDKYFAYALSTIVSRSLPDLRDGLKPVHRRLLYAMYELNLEPTNGYKKCARIVGDVLGKFHPHGDSSVYDALVRMAQEFSMRYPLIEGQGNFGSVDGDSQASMRYTESKLTKFAMLLLNDLESDTVDFKNTYDGANSEPLVLPAAIPNILANGAEGIAVGMATSVPPHNILELIEAMLLLIKDPETKLQDITKVFHGPDFPGGGNIIDDIESRLQTYETGKGFFILRSNWFEEKLERGKYQIVIDEIPYQVNKRKLIEQLADLFQNKKIPFVENLQDQSDEKIRIIITPKSRDLNAESIMESLYQLTDLEIKFNVNLNLLNKDSQPNVMGLRDILNGFLEHRSTTLKRKLEFRLNIILNRIEVLDGLIKAYLNLDEIIHIIRTEDNPKDIMISKWNFSAIQADSILNTKLKALRKLEEKKIIDENETLKVEKAVIEKVLHSSKNFKEFLKKDLIKTQKFLFKDANCKRRTKLINLQTISPVKVHLEVDNSLLIVTLSKNGWLKAFKELDSSKVKYRLDDEERFVTKALLKDKIVIFSSLGKFYNIKVTDIPQKKGDGEAIKLILDFADHEEVISMFVYKSNVDYLIATRDGKGFRVSAKDITAHTKAGKNVLQTSDNNAFFCEEVLKKYIITMSENRRLLLIEMKDIPVLRRGKGVTLQKMKNCNLSKLVMCDNQDVIKYLPSDQQNIDFWLGSRGSSGKMVTRFSNKYAADFFTV